MTCNRSLIGGVVLMLSNTDGCLSCLYPKVTEREPYALFLLSLLLMEKVYLSHWTC